MNRSRRVWDELMRMIEEALAAFSGVSPDLIVHSPEIPEKTLPIGWEAPPFVASITSLRKKNTAEKLHKER